MQYIPGILFLTLLPLAFYSFILFDRLVEAEYEMHREFWEADGKPSGMFWRHQRCEWLTSDIARARVGWRWFFHKPPWVAASPQAARRYGRWRKVTLISNLACVAWFLISVFVMHLAGQ